MNTKTLTNSQKQWRHGYFSGVKKAIGSDCVRYVDADELAQLKRDSLLLGIMYDMGINDRDSGQYWPGIEQAAAIFSDVAEFL